MLILFAIGDQGKRLRSAHKKALLLFLSFYSYNNHDNNE